MDTWFDTITEKYLKKYYNYDKILHTYKKMGSITIKDNIVSCSIKNDNNEYNRVSIEFELFSDDERRKIIEAINNVSVNKFKLINKTIPDDLLNLGIKILPDSLDDLIINCSVENNIIDIISVLKFFNKKLQDNPFLIFKMKGLDLRMSTEYDAKSIEDIFKFNFKSQNNEISLTDLYDVSTVLLMNPHYPTKSFDFIYSDLVSFLNEQIELLKIHSPPLNNTGISFESDMFFNVDSDYNLSDFSERDFFILLNEIRDCEDISYSWRFLVDILELTYDLIGYNAVMPQLFLNDDVVRIRWIPSFFDDNVLNLCKSYYSGCPDNLITFDNNVISRENQVIILVSVIIKGLIDYLAEIDEFKISSRNVSDIVKNLLLTKPHKLKSRRNNATVQNIVKNISVFYLKELDYSYAIFIDDNFNVKIKIKTDDKYKSINEASEDELRHMSVIYNLFTYFKIENVMYEDVFLSNHELLIFIRKIRPLLKYLNVELNCSFDIIESSMTLVLDTNLNKNNFILSRINDIRWLVRLDDTTVTLSEFDACGDDSSEIIKIRDKCYFFNDGYKYRVLKGNVWFFNREFEVNRVLQLALLKRYGGIEFELSDNFNNLLSVSTLYDPPVSLTGELRPYQKLGYSWLVQNMKSGFGSILADDMGLGKTVQVLSAILYLKENRYFDDDSVLVIVPPTLISNWEREILKFTPDLSYYIYHGQGRVFPVDTYDIVLTSYAVVRNDLELFLDIDWLVCVIDEAQNIKNPNIQQTKSIKSISAISKVALTGTPIENRLMDYWSIFDFVNKGYLSDMKDFKSNYVVPIEKLEDERVLNNLKTIAKPFVLRRLKTDSDIKRELPEKFVNDIYCDLTKKQVKLYNFILNGIFEDIEKSKGIERKGMILKIITALKQTCNHPAQYLNSNNPGIKESGKMELLINILENILDVDEKVIIFTQYVKMGEIIQDLVSKKFKLDVLFLHGSQSRKEKSRIVRSFQEDASFKILVATLKTGGIGLNLTAAHNVIHYDLWWNPAIENQATDRVHRIGQKNDVMVYRFITKGTLEEEIDRIIKNKNDLAGKAISNDETFITEMSNEELRKILSLRLT